MVAVRGLMATVTGLFVFLLLFGEHFAEETVGPLYPPNRNLAEGHKVTASSTCGEVNGRPIREMYCTIAGASPYTPYNQYTYALVDERKSRFQEMRGEAGSFIQGGQNCDYCEANTSSAHPASNMADGSPAWWQSPPLSRGMDYREVNITFDLEQPFYISYVWVQMANSPRPGTWILERSGDFGKSWQPWQYFASSPAECSRMFGLASLRPIAEDDDVICTSEFSSIHPMDNGEIMINLIEGRPSKNTFGGSQRLQNFVSATHVRMRLLRPKTLQGHLMDLHGHQDQTPDVTVTRRYYYGIKEVYLVGRCNCNGHSQHCDKMDPNRPQLWLCECEHNTEGENCQLCRRGFEQKRWRQSHEGDPFVCEPCNCHGHSNECQYEEELDRMRLSLDINGQFVGGGRCLNCQHNTEGINCNRCKAGYFRPPNKQWNEPDVCQPCVCNPAKHTGNCAEESGECECLPKFTGPNCDQCAPGYFHPPECRPCECNVNGTVGGQCLPDSPDGQCPCKAGFAGKYCEKCAAGFTNISAGCVPCGCDAYGAVGAECDLESGQCPCKSSFGGLQCDKCAKGYFRLKDTAECVYCDCDPSGTEDEICDGQSGQCLCRPCFAGRRCDHCHDQFYGYPACRECQCYDKGSKSGTCDPVTGECPCFANFTGRTCDKCAAGYYRLPECLACGCSSAGSKGLTCDQEGQCYCRTNFEGKQCDKCKPNFFNWPVCEECNCHPAGVVPEFAGCDKVPPGELCTCRANVQGRTCSQCKPNHWDLQAHHPDGCIHCNCNMTGTIALSNACDQLTGQCECKRFVDGQKCDLCQEGFYNIRADSHVGCEPCKCDVGGAIGIGCNQETGQCRCRPRIGGLKCDQPIQDHYFPTLWHNRYEAEDGRLPDGKNVRFAIDPNEFPDFSWRGFVVFSTIQEEIVLDVFIRKSAVYKLLVHYRNPTEVNVELEARFVPIQTQTADSEQSAKVMLEPSGAQPANAFVQSKKTSQRPFVLNPGRWQLHLKSPKRLFIDYVVLIPSEYYLGSHLTEHILEPCRANQSQNCIEMLYPPAPIATSVSADKDLGMFEQLEPGTDNVQAMLSHSPTDLLPLHVGHGALVHVDDAEQSKEFRVRLDVPEEGIYMVLVDYHSQQQAAMPIRVHVQQGDNSVGDGIVLINHCPYAFFCRQLMSAAGRPAMLSLQKSPLQAALVFTVQPGSEFSLGAVSLIKEDQWNADLLKQRAKCVRKNGECVLQSFPQPPKSIRAEAESGGNVNLSIAGDKLPFPVAGDAGQLRVMSLDSVQSTLDIEGVVAQPGVYIFVVHYYSPENPPIVTDVLVQNERFADALFHFCPSQSGCRTTVVDKHSGQRHFRLEDKYVLTFYANNTHQRGPIYIDYVLPVPVETFADSVLQPLPIPLADEFVAECAEESLENFPANVSDRCRDQIFSLTADFNGAALSCDCNAQGSLDFACAEYGGQCRCKPNVIGRICERCAPGYFGFPDCIKCKCGANHQCDERNGQCFCPRFVEGLACDRCVQYAYGFDPLIGCQLCGCSINGSMDGEQRCDPLNGQCLCKENVGGRRCEKCLPGYWAFPECQECDCQQSGTTDDVCDVRTAQCHCKKNVAGPRCDQCRPGTFDLRKSDLDGCSECFCFRVTDRCRSSNWPIMPVRVPDVQWRVDDPNGSVEVDDQGNVVYTAGEQKNESVYFEVKLQPGMDYSRMYGLHLSFVISSFPSDERSRASINADVRLIAGNTLLEHWASEQPRNASQRFNVVASLFPEYWLTRNGEPASRSLMMTTLLRLERVQVKASYYERPSRAVLEQFQLEMADPGALAVDEYGLARPTASSVELCECPPPYSGHSCQECSPGFYRLPAQSGQLLGSCVPCQCHSHSGSCDPATGICMDCRHNTEGDHCERCREGFYGNASTGSAAACLRCPCPHPIESNNFAHSCSVSELGILERCHCQRGYAGDRCEVCAPGFFGNPLVPNGRCEQCDCSGNNDLSNPGSCHPHTGDCALCKGNTDGRHCEYCKQWYWGDAVQAKNCTECECDQCGAAHCEPASGQCTCHAMVEGERCNRCVENTWGFDACRGCQPCRCELAASNSQCDLKTGQCVCMPGATGQFCDRCAHGFWNYGTQGCQKCDCESDLSLGTVCDVQTGQCHCQEGATGPRCDKCLPKYLRVPGYGCRLCDECVYSLSQETDQMELRVAHLHALLANVSSETLTGARLNRIQRQMSELAPTLERVVAVNSPEAEQLGTELTPKATQLKDAASAAAIRAQRAHEQLEQLDRRLDTSYGQLGQIRTNANELLEMVRLSIDKIGQLQRRFETQGPLEISRENLKADAEAKLELIRQLDQGQREALGTAQERQATINTTVNRIGELQGKTEQLAAQIAEKRAKLGELNEMKHAFVAELDKTRTGLGGVQKILDMNSLSLLRKFIGSIEKDAGILARNIAEQQLQLANVTQMLQQLDATRTELEQQIAELDTLKGKLTSRVQRRRRRQTAAEQLVEEKRAQLNEKIVQLEAEAHRVVGIYDAARLEAQRAVEAANAYKEVTEKMREAKGQSQQALKTAKEASDTITGQQENAKKAETNSKKLKEQAASLDNSEVRELRGRVDSLAQREQQLASKLEQVKTELAGAKQSGVGEKPSGGTEVDAIQEQAEQAQQRAAPLNASLEELGTKLGEMDKRVRQLMESNEEMAAQTGTAKDQIQQMEKAIPELQADWEEAKQRVETTVSKARECRTKLALLKEKVVLARDKANRVTLGAHFERDSLLELPVPQSADDFASITDVRFFFRTREQNGLLMFLGSNNSQLTGEFLAIELEQERPKLTVNLGARTAGEVRLDSPVNDQQWRELTVQRRGKRATLAISKPGMDERAEEKVLELTGPKSVLNLFDDSRHLFVGAMPPQFQLPASLRQRHFVGDMEKLRVNGELLGLWNSEKAERISGAEMRHLPDAERNAEAGVTFNGKGYMQMDVGIWNPRKRTAIMLSFMSYSPDGLLFFVGKDRDQLVLELVAGRISLLFDLGSGPAKLMSNGENYNDGKWHLVEVDRMEKTAKLEVDGTDKVEGESPGSMFEMSVSDSFYLGGLPTTIESTRFAVHPFRGCIRNLKLDSEYVSLARPRATKGVQSSCVNREVRIGTLLSERSFARFTGPSLGLGGQLVLSFRFRPADYRSKVPVLLASLMVNNDQEELLRVNIENGTMLAIRTNGDESGLIRAELGHQHLANGWHHLTVTRDAQTMRAFVDDVLEEDRPAPIEDVDLLNSNDVLLAFGRLPSEPIASFVGCLGDLLLNGRLLSLAEASGNELTLSACTTADAINAGVEEEATKAAENGGGKAAVAGQEAKAVTEQEERAKTTPAPKPRPAAKVRPEGACALPLQPHGEREDSGGSRFGLVPSARLEFAAGPIAGADLSLSAQLRATAANGIVMFATDERHNQYATLYLQDGKPAFAWKRAQTQWTIQSNASLLDDEWHTVRAQREGHEVTLYVNGHQVVHELLELKDGGGDTAAEALELQSPLYVGGLPPELVPFAARLLPGVKAEFGGCLREFTLNDRPLEAPTKEVGTAECAQYTEAGMFFGKDGGYAVLSRQFVVGTSFSLELEMKARTKSAVLLSVGVLEFLSLQMLNGTVKFSVDNGAGVESVVYEPPPGTSLCDGHWHQVKIYKKKRLLTLNVDGKSNLKIMQKKSASETSTRDPLYLGGVPRDVKMKGLDTQEPYVGCMRVISLGRKDRRRRRRRNVPNELSNDLELFGSVDRNSCPLN